MNENDIKIINTSYHKKMTDNHLAQINFTAILPKQLWDIYIEKTNIDKQNLGRIRFLQLNSNDLVNQFSVMVFGRVSHGYGYDISQDIYNSIIDSKGTK